ncbi:trypco2 family protein [Glycomyces xiaoerkulensis]|uniref:trypco2 family protein n=1 Tax=Glycomyces xiaoerkulensis TaxID=2038139 RepID=UPI000C25FAB7|nr:trypco2 family protein [Glycomyces xiaoerkulensis]
MTTLSLSDAVASLRRELKTAMAAADDDLRLEVKELELELTLQAASEAGAEAGVNLWSVVTGKVSAKDTDSRMHRLRIVLSPLVTDADGAPRPANMSKKM